MAHIPTTQSWRTSSKEKETELAASVEARHARELAQPPEELDMSESLRAARGARPTTHPARPELAWDVAGSSFLPPLALLRCACLR